MMFQSSLEKLRTHYSPIIPKSLQNLQNLRFSKENFLKKEKELAELEKLFPLTFNQLPVIGKSGETRVSRPLRIGVVFSGGQAAGGHNVIAGLFDALKLFHANSELFGFLDGPSGIVDNKYEKLTFEKLAFFRNQGGFDLIGSGRTKIETEEQLKASVNTVLSLKLDGLVVIGGDDSNTNAAFLAEYFLASKLPTRVIGVPKTIDGDLKNDWVAISFGFDTACKVYSEMIGNIERDAISAKKYTHFIKLMGRSASHITLECALRTHPNVALIGEEIALEKQTLIDITSQLADVVCKRSLDGKNYGVFLIPEGVIEFIPEVNTLIKELNLLFSKDPTLNQEEVASKLNVDAKRCFLSLPQSIQRQLLLERDPHGNIQVSLVETEKLFIEMVSKEIEERKKRGEFKGKFNPIHHFFGYEGRASFPSNFDCSYCYALGRLAAVLIDEGLTGYMACIQGLTKNAEEWEVAGLPITKLMNFEMRHGKMKPVIQKALVDLSGKPFLYFKSKREQWILEDEFQFPGPIQFFGERSLTDEVPISLSRF